jgi:hypothetical protein
VSTQESPLPLTKKFDRAAWRRIALSAIKAFIAGVLSVLIVSQADLISGDWTAVKGVVIAALISGLDAIGKAIQIALEEHS